MASKWDEDKRPDDEFLEVRDVPIEGLALRQVFLNTEPKQHEIAVGNLEAWLGVDIKDWKDEDGKDYGELVDAKLKELSEKMKGQQYEEYRRTQYALFKFGLLCMIYRENKPKFLRGKFT